MFEAFSSRVPLRPWHVKGRHVFAGERLVLSVYDRRHGEEIARDLVDAVHALEERIADDDRTRELLEERREDIEELEAELLGAERELAKARKRVEELEARLEALEQA